MSAANPYYVLDDEDDGAVAVESDLELLDYGGLQYPSTSFLLLTQLQTQTRIRLSWRSAVLKAAKYRPRARNPTPSTMRNAATLSPIVTAPSRHLTSRSRSTDLARELLSSQVTQSNWSITQSKIRMPCIVVTSYV